MEMPQRKYFAYRDVCEAAKEIRDVLKRIQEKVGEINSRSLIRQELKDYENEELKEGVMN